MDTEITASIKVGRVNPIEKQHIYIYIFLGKQIPKTLQIFSFASRFVCRVSDLVFNASAFYIFSDPFFF